MIHPTRGFTPYTCFNTFSSGGWRDSARSNAVGSVLVDCWFGSLRVAVCWRWFVGASLCWLCCTYGWVHSSLGKISDSCWLFCPRRFASAAASSAALKQLLSWQSFGLVREDLHRSDPPDDDYPSPPQGDGYLHRDLERTPTDIRQESYVRRLSGLNDAKLSRLLNTR